jgi:hypothetical protein
VVAENRGWTAGLDGGEEPALERHVAVADGVDAAVDRVQTAVAHADLDCLVVQPTRSQLRDREHAPRARRTRSDTHIGTSVGSLSLRLNNPTSVAA